MALPAARSPEQLAKMKDDRLQKYFEKYARYFPENPADSQYAIRFGTRSLFSHDTADLRDKFFAAVREFTNVG